MPRHRHLLVACVLLLGLSGCGADAAPPAAAEVTPASTEKFRQPSDLQCESAPSSGLVVDYETGAVGEPTPELAARAQLDQSGVDLAQLTERVMTDADGSTFVDYRSPDDRLVLFVELSPGAEGTWLASYVYACADATSQG